MLWVQRGDDLALLVGLRRQVAIQARQRHVDRRVGQFEQVGEALHRMLETGHPGKQRLRHRLEAGRRVVGARRLEVVELEDQRIEPAVLGDRARQRRVAAQDQRLGTRAPGPVGIVGQRLALEVEHMRQPGLGFEQHRLHDHAAQVAVEHHGIERLEGLGRL